MICLCSVFMRMQCIHKENIRPSTIRITHIYIILYLIVVVTKANVKADKSQCLFSFSEDVSRERKSGRFLIESTVRKAPTAENSNHHSGKAFSIHSEPIRRILMQLQPSFRKRETVFRRNPSLPLAGRERKTIGRIANRLTYRKCKNELAKKLLSVLIRSGYRCCHILPPSIQEAAFGPQTRILQRITRFFRGSLEHCKLLLEVFSRLTEFYHKGKGFVNCRRDVIWMSVFRRCQEILKANVPHLSRTFKRIPCEISPLGRVKRTPAQFQLVNTTAVLSEEVDNGTLGTDGNDVLTETVPPQNRTEFARKHSPISDSRKGEPDVVYVHGLFEITSGDCRQQRTSGIYELKAAQLAIQHVNEKGVIPGYRMEMYYNDTKCDSGVAVDSFFYSLYLQPTMTMMLGPGSAEVTERLARVVSRWNIVQVSYGATSPALSDRENFPFFFRTVAPDSSHNPALLCFIQHHGWDTVATLHEQGDNHALPMNKLVVELEQANISVSFTKGVSERDYKEHLQELKVYRLGMFGAEYAWILQGELMESWWLDPDDTECSKSELERAAKGVIVVGNYYMVGRNISTFSRVTIRDVLHDIGYSVRDPRDSGFVSQAYDAVWAMALALQKAEDSWKNGTNTTLKDFTYSNYKMAEEISSFLGKLNFIGISGPVSFRNSDRVGITSFHQNQGKRNELSLVCLHYPHSEKLNFDCEECVSIVWQGDSVPVARRIIRLQIAVLDHRVLICVTSLALFGVMLALVFLSFNLYYRKCRFIKLSSPNLNNFVVVGCILVYMAMILLGMDYSTLLSHNHFGVVCSARAFLLSGGFSLAFGCMFIKTYRVYHIFIRRNTGIVKSKLLHDKQLLGMVSVLVLVDCIIVTLWVTLDPMERHLRNLTMQVNPSERNVVYLYQREQCYSAHMVKWLGALYIYKGLLLVVGCYMAWETRHVKIPALNDSQYIGMSVYNVVITSVIVVALANVIPVERYTLTFILVSALIFVSTTMTLCLLFLPKIHTILKDNDDSGAVVATPGVKVECKTRRFAVDEPNESIYRAEVLNRALKRELHELEEELARISKKAGIIPPDLHNLKANRNKVFGEEDDNDSDDDDDLPPWFAEYKRYPTEDSIWFTQKEDRQGACFSALSALHPLLMSTVDYPGSETCNESDAGQEQMVSKPSSPQKSYATELRASLPTVTLLDCQKRISARGNGEPQSSISERTLDFVARSAKPLLSRAANWSMSKLSIDHRDDFLNNDLKSKQYSKSATRLQGEYSRQNELYSTPPTGSLLKLACNEKSESALSVNTTSCGSEWTTAPMYSSSFVTATENGSSSNNNTLVTPSGTPDPQVQPRGSLTDSNQSSNSFYSNEDSSSNSDKAELYSANHHEPTYHENVPLLFQECCDASKSSNSNARTHQQTGAVSLSSYPNNHDPETPTDVPGSEACFTADGCPLISAQAFGRTTSSLLETLGTDSPCDLSDWSNIHVPSNVYIERHSNSSGSSSLLDYSSTIEHTSNEDEQESSCTQDITFVNTPNDAKDPPSLTLRDEHSCELPLPNTAETEIGYFINKPDTGTTANEPNDNYARDHTEISQNAVSDSINPTAAETSDGNQTQIQSSDMEQFLLSDENETPTASDSSNNNNSSSPSDTQLQYNTIRQQIFQLERDLILLELDRSKSTDL